VRLIHNYLFPAMWLTYVAYWWAMAAHVKETKQRESVWPRLPRQILLICAILLLALPRIPLPFLSARFLPLGDWSFWTGAAITAAGLLFSVWARRHLGANWSQAVTLKQDHELITSGPYALVRHPIYTGLLLALLGSALARGEWRGLLAVLIVFGVLWQKLRLEETFMRNQFGESYEAYSRRVTALVPYII